MNNDKVGCYSQCIYQSVKHTIENEKPFFKKIIHDINNESISELISTKAVIDDLNRELKTDFDMSRRETKSFLKKMEKFTESKIPEEKKKKKNQNNFVLKKKKKCFKF